MSVGSISSSVAQQGVSSSAQVTVFNKARSAEESISKKLIESATSASPKLPDKGQRLSVVA